MTSVLPKHEGWYPHNVLEERKMLRKIAVALKEYQSNNKTVEDFEKEYGCTVLYDNMDWGIRGLRFHKDSNMTAFMLKYNL